MSYQELKLSQIDRDLSKARSTIFERNSYPDGFIKTIRQAMGISTRQLAKRLKVSQTSVVSAEKNEVLNKITIAKLDKIADALGCKLVYTFVPKTSLVEVVNHQAETIAKNQVDMVNHYMKLESQGVSKSITKNQIESIKAELLKGSWSKLWD